MQCFALYIAVLAAHQPERVGDLMVYMIIAKASKKYKWLSRVVYDLNFRQEAASNPYRNLNRKLIPVCILNVSWEWHATLRVGANNAKALTIQQIAAHPSVPFPVSTPGSHQPVTRAWSHWLVLGWYAYYTISMIVTASLICDASSGMHVQSVKGVTEALQH